MHWHQRGATSARTVGVSIVALLLAAAGLGPEPARAAEAGASAEQRPAAQDAGPSANSTPAGEASAEETMSTKGELIRLLQSGRELFEAGRYAEAEPLYKRVLEIRERALPADHPDIAESLNNLAALYTYQGRYTEAEPLYKRALEIRERALPADRPESLNNLATLYVDQGRYAEAEELLKRALAMLERALPADPHIAYSLNNLAMLYRYQGRYTEAEELLKRALEIRERTLPADHPDPEESLEPSKLIADSLNNLAALYADQGRSAEAEELLKRALEIRERTLPADHPDIAESLNNLAAVYTDQGRYTEAEPLSKRALEIRERALPADHPDIAQNLTTLAMLYADQGRYAEAEELFQRALEIRERALPADHPDIADSLANWAWLAFLEGRPDLALARVRRANAIWTAPVNRPSVARHKKDFYLHAISALAASTAGGEAAEHGPAPAWYQARLSLELRSALAEAFEADQWPQQGQAAQALAQMGARSSAKNPELAELVRRRESRLEEHRRANTVLIAALGKTDSERRQAQITTLQQRINELSAELKSLDRELHDRFPEYAELALPQPLSFEQMQTLLGNDEVLVSFLLSPPFKGLEEKLKSFVFTLDNQGFYWGKIPNEKTLAEEVKALRRGLDPEDAVRGGSHPGQVGRTSYDLALAHELYKQLLGPVEAHLKDKRHWIVVPDGALTGLPFQVLVTATPEAARDEATAYQQAAWLIRDHALMVLPAVANLRLRELRKDKKSASEPFTGFGDPVIGSTGPIACPEPLAPVPVAMDPSKMPAGKVLVRSAAGVESDSLFRSGATAEGVLVADVERVRALPRLPDTRCELEGLARQLGAPRTTVHVAEAATETAVKELSESGELARYRLVAFATHGLTANEGEGMRKGQGTELKPLLVAAGSAPADAEEVKAEPALVLTPPKQGTIADDGLLTASEVVALKLNAEWVLLSACNTAGEAEPGAESLSGLAKAFFYAGADSLLVSNWPVYSDAAVQLTTGAIKALVAEPGIGRAEALRRSMLAFLDPQRPSGDAHPSRWGPFTLVGEGQPQSGKGK